ncbi:hypothetical protein L1987_72739 [Smallanthus sonchifolius]|uniref:Uncharacterized protein n=1 Tax=Smallanthus sonchifolius TaxID=185202 RepID=A0ACB9AWB6_9ASTR|nr:hypothetical protein L1987_72739 [Smallanthus sonchifolius]
MGLVSLLQAAWVLATLPIVAAWLPFPGLGWLRRPLLGFAKRGKILQSNTVKINHASEILLSLLRGGHFVDNNAASCSMVLCYHDAYR